MRLIRPGSPHVVVALDSFEDQGLWRAAIDSEWPSPRYASDTRAVLAQLDEGTDLLVAFPMSDGSQSALAAEVRRRMPACVVISVAPKDTDARGGCNDIVERGSTPQILVERARRCLAPPSYQGTDYEALERMPVGIALLDMGGAFLFANRVLRDLLDVPAVAPIDRFHTRAFFWDRPAWEQLLATSRRGRRTTLLGVQTLVGRRCLLEATASATREGTTLLLREPPADDQRVRDLAEALARSEQRYRAILEDQNDMVTRSRPDGTLTYANPATCRILGVPAERLIGRNWHDFVCSPEALRVAVERIDSLAADHAHIMNDTPIRTETGEVRWFSWENRAIFDREGCVSEISAVGRDVTDRRRAEVALSESETALKSFYDGTPLLMGVAEVNDGQIVVIHANATTAQYFGTTPEGLVGHPLLGLGVPPAIHAIWLSQFDRAQREGHSVVFDYTRSKPSGERWLNATVSCLGGDGPPRFSFVIQDNTARRDVERRLALHSDLLARVHDAVIATDESSRVTSWNAGAVATFGWTEREALARLSDEVMPVEVAGQATDSGLARLIREGKYEGEMVYRRRDGTPFSADVKSAILRGPNGERSGVVISVLDISRRKRAEAALNESEGRLATLFREAPVGITITRLSDGRFLDVNPAFCALFGYSREEILGHTVTDLNLTSDREYRPRILAELAVKETVRGRVAPLRHRSGEWRECLIAYGRVRLSGQDCLVTILQDMTDRRRTEQQLERALGEREVLLREIHHRVKNNLQLLSSLMSFELSRGRGVEVRQVAESLERRIHAMAVVHEHLYGAHDLSSLPADVYLGDLLRANLAAHGDAAARLTISVDVAPLALSLDVALRVGLIVSELTSNALRHAFTGTGEGRLVLRLTRYGERGFELIVRDDGVGIDADAESQTATLGLRLVRQIARQLEGQLSCVRQSGTTWTLQVAELE